MSSCDISSISRLLNKRLKELQAQAQVLRIWLLCHPLAVLMKLIHQRAFGPMVWRFYPSRQGLMSRAIGVSSRVCKGKGAIAFWAGPNLVVWARYAFWARGHVATNYCSKKKTNKVNTAYGVSTANTQVSPVALKLALISTKDLLKSIRLNIEEMDLKWQLALLSMRTRRFFQKTGRKITINGSDTTGYDKSKVECFNCHKMGHFVREYIGPRNQDSRNRNQDNSRRTVNVMKQNFIQSHGLFLPPKFDLSNSGLEEFQQPEFEGYGPKPSKSVSEDISNEVRESPDALLVKELVSDDKLEKKTADCNYHQRERVVSGNNYTRVNYNYSAKKAHPSAHRNIVPRAVLMKTDLRSLKLLGLLIMLILKLQFIVLDQCHPPKEDQGYVDSGCSRHMTGNMSYLSYFKEFDVGYVTFRGGAKGGKITSKGTLKTVFFLLTLDVLLSPDFKLADENQVLLKVPREKNMYSVDMKNIIPKESLTCLVAKATLDES
ncbi:ribonuclease H-like domain-containing protein, partial [Tanacetum coccineum]